MASCDESIFTASDGVQIFVRRFEPLNRRAVQAVLHVHHGIAEHSARYAGLAERLGLEGIATVVHDARCHGRTVKMSGLDVGCVALRGADGATEQMIKDFQELLEDTARGRPGVPILLLGHSWGTVVTQLLVGGGGIEGLPVAGVILSAPPARIPAVVLSVLRPLLGGIQATKAKGEHDIAAIAKKITFDKCTNGLKSAVPAVAMEGDTGFECLNRDVAEVKKYVDDELCGFDMSIGFWRSAGDNLKRILQPEAHAKLPAGLPVAIFAGDHDYFTLDDFGVASYTQIRKEYFQAGKPTPKVIVYPGARHEILLETNREEVMEDMWGFFRSCLARPPASRL